VADGCSWLKAGRPRAAHRPVGQRYEGTDRQCRGRLLAVLRDAEGPVTGSYLEAAWPVPVQRARALDGLVADGLVDALPEGRYALPC
jgi:A/G-specific adenine glycosylase